MAGESDCGFVQSVEKLLEAGNTIEAKSVFCATEHAEEVKNNSWDLIPALSKFLSIENNRNFREVFKCSQELLIFISDTSNPEEALLQFIEEIEEADSDFKFVALLEPLRKVLIRIPKKVSMSLAWGFNSIQCYLNKHEVPDSENLQGKEKLLLDNTGETQIIKDLYKHVIQFYEMLILDIASKEDSEEISLIKLKFLIGLLGKPFVYLDVEVFDGIKNPARLASEQLVSKIFQIHSDPTTLLLYRFFSGNDVFKLNDLGLASFYYLVFSENISIEKVFKVYESAYFFQNCLYLVTTLLKTNHQIVVEKGLKLSASILQHVKYSNLSYLLLDSFDHEDFSKTVANVIIYNEVECFRKLGLDVYQTYLSSFETHGFYLIIYNLVPELTHPGLRGYTITLYKNLLVRDFNNTDNIYIRGQKLVSMLKKFCFLNKKEESDLVELADEIIATLNLLRFIAIKDKLNTTQFWNYVPILTQSYFEPMRKGIELSRAHYKLKIKEIQDQKVDKRTDNINVLVKGESLSMLSKNEKLEVLNQSLTAFDIIDSLLSRLMECIDLQGR